MSDELRAAITAAAKAAVAAGTAMPYESAIIAVASCIEAGFRYGEKVIEKQDAAVSQKLTEIHLEVLRPVMALAKGLNDLLGLSEA